MKQFRNRDPLRRTLRLREHNDRNAVAPGVLCTTAACNAEVSLSNPKTSSRNPPNSTQDAVFLTWLVGDKRDDVPVHLPGQRGLVDRPEVGAPAGDEHRQPLPPPGPGGVTTVPHHRASPEEARVWAPGQLAPDGVGLAVRR
jgi:hypothetical protein